MRSEYSDTSSYKVNECSLQEVTMLKECSLLQLEGLKLGETSTNGASRKSPSPDDSNYFEKIDEDARKALNREQLLESYRQHQKVRRFGIIEIALYTLESMILKISR